MNTAPDIGGEKNYSRNETVLPKKNVVGDSGLRMLCFSYESEPVQRDIWLNMFTLWMAQNYHFNIQAIQSNRLRLQNTCVTCLICNLELSLRTTELMSLSSPYIIDRLRPNWRKRRGLIQIICSLLIKLILRNKGKMKIPEISMSWADDRKYLKFFGIYLRVPPSKITNLLGYLS